MNKFTKLTTFNYLTVEDLLMKVACFDKYTWNMVVVNCWKGIMSEGIKERILKVHPTNHISDVAISIASLFEMEVNFDR